MNDHLYGPSAKESLGFQSLEFKHVIPFVPWEGIVIQSVTHSWLVEKESRNAEFVRGEDEHLTYQLTVIWNI